MLLRFIVLAVALHAAASSSIEFGLHDFEVAPAGGWQLMSAEDFTTHKAAFVASYNSKKGISPIAVFQSGNCCIAESLHCVRAQ